MSALPVLRAAALCGSLISALAAPPARAAPHALTYTGMIESSDFPEILPGQRYSVTFIVDNGGTVARGQSWSAGDLRCTIWRMNNAGNAVLRQDLVATPPTATGTATTDAAGVLTQMFTEVYMPANSLPAGSYSTSGLALVDPVQWFVRGPIPGVLYDSGSQDPVLSNRIFVDASGAGISMAPTFWSAPRAVAGLCDDTPLAGPGGAASVPGPGMPALALLGLGALALAGLRLRKPRSTAP